MRAGRDWLAVTPAYYRDALALACRKAGVPAFKPNQLRHAKANEIQERYEDDAAVAAVLGNSPQVASAVYVDGGPKDAVARRIAEELG